MKSFDGRVAAITGAASGIGRALAVALSEQGCHLALSDVNSKELTETAKQCSGGAGSSNVDITCTTVDVADRAAVFEWAESSADHFGQINLIFNNAGVNLTHDASTQSVEDIAWVMEIDFWGVVHGTQAFLPHLRAATAGHVVNISSVFGLVSIPTQSAYNAAKFGVRGYTDALRMELELEGSHVSTTTVHPGGIKTNIVRNGRSQHGSITADRFDKMAMTTPEKAAQQILTAVQRNRRRCLVGPDAVLFDLGSRLPAALTHRIVKAVSKRNLGPGPATADLEQPSLAQSSAGGIAHFPEGEALGRGDSTSR